MKKLKSILRIIKLTLLYVILFLVSILLTDWFTSSHKDNVVIRKEKSK